MTFIFLFFTFSTFYLNFIHLQVWVKRQFSFWPPCSNWNRLRDKFLFWLCATLVSWLFKSAKNMNVSPNICLVLRWGLRLANSLTFICPSPELTWVPTRGWPTAFPYFDVRKSALSWISSQVGDLVDKCRFFFKEDFELCRLR